MTKKADVLLLRCCNFCGCNENSADILIHSDGVYICDSCILAAISLIVVKLGVSFAKRIYNAILDAIEERKRER